MAGSTRRKRRSRGGPRSGGTGSAAAPRGVPSERRELRAERRAVAERERRAGQRMLGTVGERPPGPFGSMPVSELAILIGAIAFVVGVVQYLTGSGVQPALYVGVLVVAAGVIEVTAREHFTGYRSHTTLLAGMPTIVLGIVLIASGGSQTTRRTLLVVLVPVFAVLFWVLRRAFLAARARRVARR